MTPTNKSETTPQPSADRPNDAAAPTLPSSARRKMIAEAAYARARERGFEPGHELEDWLAAENEIVKMWVERIPGAQD